MAQSSTTMHHRGTRIKNDYDQYVAVVIIVISVIIIIY